MAEAWARHLFPAGWQAASAGLITYPIVRRTRAVMQEVGLDMAGQHAKPLEAVDLDSFDLVVTLSEEAGRYLPALPPSAVHWRRPIPDPMAAGGTPEEERAAFRAGRDRVLGIVREVLAAYAGPPSPQPLSDDPA